MFHDHGPRLLKVVRKWLKNNHLQVNNRAYKEAKYLEICESLANMPEKEAKQMLFRYLDVGKDGRISETDIFKIISSFKSKWSYSIIEDDLAVILKAMDNNRRVMGRSD